MATPIAFQKIQFDDQTTSLFQDNVSNAFTQVQGLPLVGGELISSVSLISGQDNLINHSLRYTPTMILPLVPNVDTRIWSPVSASLSGSNVSTAQFNLRCSSSCTVSVFVK